MESQCSEKVTFLFLCVHPDNLLFLQSLYLNPWSFYWLFPGSLSVFESQSILALLLSSFFIILLFFSQCSWRSLIPPFCFLYTVCTRKLTFCVFRVLCGILSGEQEKLMPLNWRHRRWREKFWILGKDFSWKPWLEPPLCFDYFWRYILAQQHL